MCPKFFLMSSGVYPITRKTASITSGLLPRMLPPAISEPFRAISYCVVRISGIRSPRTSHSLCSGFGDEKGLCVKVHLGVPSGFSPAFSSFSKNGKSITQQNARRFGSSLSFRTSGRSVPYFATASLYESRGNGISCIRFFGRSSCTMAINRRSLSSITSSRSTCAISRSSWVNSLWRSPRVSSSRKQRGN